MAVFFDAADLDRSVVIAASDGTHLPSGTPLTGPVTGVDKLESLICWAHEKRGLLHGSSARIWVIGAAVRQLTGSDIVEQDLDEELGRTLAGLVPRGWELAGGEGRFTLSRATGSGRLTVELVAESQPWLALGDDVVSDDAGELGRRLHRWVASVGTLPERSGARSAAEVLDAIRAAKSPRRHVPIISGALPAGVVVDTMIQPAWVIDNSTVDRALAKAEELVFLKQKHPMLASAGMISLGSGEPIAVNGEKAIAAAHANKRPFGLWLASLPAADTLDLPADLPLPHPAMRFDGPTQVWLSSQDLTGLGAAVRDGGAGLAIGDLRIAAAILWPHQGRLLETWAARFREGLADPDRHTAGLAVAAHDYLVGLGDPSAWAGRLEHHYQPAWGAAIAAHVRFRGRRAAMRISREYKLWPIYARDGGFIYAVGLDESTGETIDLADTHTRLGRLVTAGRAVLSDDHLIEVLDNETDDQLAATLTSLLDISAGTAETALSTAPAEQTAAPKSAVRGEGDVPAAAEPVPADEDAAADTPQRSPARRPAKPKSGAGGVVAAVLHTDGLWFPDGTRFDLPEPIVHVGQVARLAWEHHIGYRLNKRYVEPGQIWVTEDVCSAVGIDRDAISRREPNKSLRELTGDLNFVSLAVADGWSLGGQTEKPQLGTWTRVFRTDTDLKGPMVVLIPGMTRKQGGEHPILDGADPAGIARRLQMFADHLGYPLKISAGGTAIDLMLELRPRTRSPQEWLEVVHAPSRFSQPFGLSDVESDFEWSRKPTQDEAAMTYIHAYDRGGSYPSAAISLELPIGDPIHHPQGVEFNPKSPGYWRIEIPEAQDWLLPDLLNPRGHKFTGPKWVCTPRLERAIALGHQPEILEAYVWPEHGRILRTWAERFRDLSANLDTGAPDDTAVRDQAKVARSAGIGLLGSLQHLEGKRGFSPERRYHIVSKASANIIHKLHQIGVSTGRWPLAVWRDTVLYASDDPDPDSAWPGDQKSYGRGFGQYKHEGSSLLAEHLQFLTAVGYKGKGDLASSRRWRAEMLAPRAPASQEED